MTKQYACNDKNYNPIIFTDEVDCGVLLLNRYLPKRYYSMCGTGMGKDLTIRDGDGDRIFRISHIPSDNFVFTTMVVVKIICEFGFNKIHGSFSFDEWQKYANSLFSKCKLFVIDKEHREYIRKLEREGYYVTLHTCDPTKEFVVILRKSRMGKGIKWLITNSQNLQADTDLMVRGYCYKEDVDSKSIMFDDERDCGHTLLNNYLLYNWSSQSYSNYGTTLTVCNSSTRRVLKIEHIPSDNFVFTTMVVAKIICEFGFDKIHGSFNFDEWQKHANSLFEKCKLFDIDEAHKEYIRQLEHKGHYVTLHTCDPTKEFVIILRESRMGKGIKWLITNSQNLQLDTDLMIRGCCYKEDVVKAAEKIGDETIKAMTEMSLEVLNYSDAISDLFKPAPNYNQKIYNELYPYCIEIEVNDYGSQVQIKTSNYFVVDDTPKLHLNTIYHLIDIKHLDIELEKIKTYLMKEYNKIKEKNQMKLKIENEITKFENGAEREVKKGKGRFDLMSPIALERYAKHMENCISEKYTERNWENGLPISNYMDSALRHLNQYMKGDKTEDHLVAAFWHIAAAMHTEELHPELQNIPSRK